MSDIKKSKRKESKLQAIHNAYVIRRAVTNLAENNFYVTLSKIEDRINNRVQGLTVEDKKRVREQMYKFYRNQINKVSDNVIELASRTNRGVSFHRKRLETHLHKYYREHKSNKGYILLMDFSGYYASIPHKKCLEVIYKHLRNTDNEEKAITMWILQNLFYLFSEENKQSKGVDIGSQPSQNIGISYPSRIDNYIKIVRQCKYYGRYTDDSYIIHEDKEFLRKILKEVMKIADSLELKINPKKTQIKKLSQTFKILQIKYYLTDTGKVVKRINSKAVTRERRKLKAYKRLLDRKILTQEEIENIFKSWMACNYKNMSMQQISNMSQLYYDLFRRKVKWKNHGKLRYLMERQLKT